MDQLRHPRATSALVRVPAVRWRHSCSNPTTALGKAVANLPANSKVVMVSPSHARVEDEGTDSKNPYWYPHRL
jgi:hypothetical protein